MTLVNGGESQNCCWSWGGPCFRAGCGRTGVWGWEPSSRFSGSCWSIFYTDKIKITEKKKETMETVKRSALPGATRGCREGEQVAHGVFKTETLSGLLSWWIHGVTHLSSTERAPRRANLSGNCRFQLIVIHPYRFINCNKCTTPTQSVHNTENCTPRRERNMGILCTAQFFCKPETALKVVYQLFNYIYII